MFGVWAPGEEVAEAHVLRSLRAAASWTKNPPVSLSATAPRSSFTKRWASFPRSSMKRRSEPRRLPRYRTRAVLNDWGERVGERAADVPPHGDRQPRTRPQRQPDEHRGTCRTPCPTGSKKSRRTPARATTDVDQRHRTHDGAARWPSRCVDQKGLPSSNCPRCVAPSHSSSWTTAPSTPRATRRIRPLVISQLDGLGRLKVRLPRSTSLAPPTSAMWARQTRRDRRRRCPAVSGLPGRPTCLFEYVPRPPGHGARRTKCPRHSRRGGTSSRTRARLRPTLSSPFPDRALPARSATRRRPASPSPRASSRTPTVGRTFISPSQTLRQLGIRLKLNPLRRVIAGKRLVVVDDSIVRGNAARSSRCCAGGCERGPRPYLVAAGQMAVLLRHRLRHARRAHRQQ